VRSEAFASPNQEPDDKRAAKKSARFVSIDGIAGATQDFDAGAVDAIFPSEGMEPANVLTEIAAPREVAHRHHREAAAPHRETTTVEIPSRPKARNWRNIVLALLGIAVLGQGALMAYWTTTRGGFAAITRQTGNVTVTSEPVGSPVAVDGAVRGQTPLTIALEAGAHSVVVGTGALARSQSVNVTRGGDASVHVELPAAEAASAVTGKAALQIATEPAGARVWVDGESRGVAPLTVSNLTAGDHAVTVRTGSGDPINRTVTIQEGATASLIVTLPGAGSFASGWLSIQSLVPLQVMENGALLGTTDMPRIMLSAGGHELELVNASLGFRSTRSITIAAGQTASVAVTLPRGTLSVNALPWAEVWIDGARIGETPIGNYSIPIGNHEVLFRHPELGEQRKTVTIDAKGPVRIGVDMKKP
jgi:hypothetical protein